MAEQGLGAGRGAGRCLSAPQRLPGWCRKGCSLPRDTLCVRTFQSRRGWKRVLRDSTATGPCYSHGLPRRPLCRGQDTEPGPDPAVCVLTPLGWMLSHYTRKTATKPKTSKGPPASHPSSSRYTEKLSNLHVRKHNFSFVFHKLQAVRQRQTSMKCKPVSF